MSLLLSSAASALTFALVSDRRNGPVVSASTFVSMRLARLWDESAQRDDFVTDLETVFDTSIHLEDADGNTLREVPSCPHFHMVDVAEDGRLLGRARVCVEHHGPAWWRVALVIGAGLSVVLLLSGILAHRLSLPLRRVASAAKRLADGDLSARVGRFRGHEETRLLARVFDRMAERLSRQIEEQREVLGLVSHEVRTPLGHLRLLVEMGREGGEVDWNELALELEELEELMAKLLAQSRVDAGHVERREVDVLALAKRALVRHGLDEEMATHEGEAIFPLDPTLIARALANMVRNAESHGGGLTGVDVHVGEELRIDVKDGGPGFDEDEHPPSEGLGLGLPLVRAIAAAHGGELSFTRVDGEHAARLSFPRTLDPS